MRIRNLSPFVLALAVACGGAETEEAATAEAGQEYGAVDAAAEVEAVAEYWETHYNMGHADMVAGTMSEDAIFWDGAGGMFFGPDAVEAQMVAELEMDPQLDLTVDETIVTGDFGVMRGTYEMTATAEGEPVTNSGYWVALTENIDGEWKTHGIVGNMDSEGQMMPPVESAEMPEGGEGAELVQERLDYYIQHFNAGHPEMVAETYTEDAVVMGSGEMMRQGRAAAQERLAEMVEAGMQISEIDIFRAREIGDDHVTAAGTYTLEGPDGAVSGHFGALYERVDGELQMKWLLTANHPSSM